MCAPSRSQTSETTRHFLGSHQINWLMQKVSFRRPRSNAPFWKCSQLHFKAANFNFNFMVLEESTDHKPAGKRKAFPQWAPSNLRHAMTCTFQLLNSLFDVPPASCCPVSPLEPTSANVKKVPRGLGNCELRCGGLLKSAPLDLM